MVGCVLGQLKLSRFSILSIRPRSFFRAKNGEFLGLYPIHNKKCNKLGTSCKKYIFNNILAQKWCF